MKSPRRGTSEVLADTKRENNEDGGLAPQKPSKGLRVLNVEIRRHVGGRPASIRIVAITRLQFDEVPR